MKVLLADDHPMYLAGLRTRIERLHPEAQIHETASLDGVLALAEGAARFDIVLIDYNMPGIHGAADVARVVRALPETTVAVISGSASPEDVHGVIQAGARGFLPKTLEPEQFAAAFATLLTGTSYVPADIVRELMAAPMSRESGVAAGGEADGTPFSTLSPRERDVLVQVAKGLSNKEIGRQLSLAEVTVKLHVRQILRKIKARNRSEAAAIATRAGFPRG